MTQNIDPSVNAYGAQDVVLQSPTGGDIPVRPDGYLRTSNEPTSLFAETFDAATIDTTDKWTSLGTAPTDSNGVLTLNQGTTALAFSGLQSKVTFPLLGNMFNQSVFIVKLDTGQKTGNYRFFGQGTAQTSPTVSAPIVNGVGFELLDTTGALFGCVYSGGTRTQSVALTTNVHDGNWHRFAAYYKTSRLYFEIDGTVVGSIAYPSPAWSNLPLLILSVNGASTVSPAATVQSSFVGIGDTSGNNSTISDGTNPWRKSKVGPYGDLSVSITNPAGAAAAVTAGVSTYGYLRATVEPHVLFSDPFDGATINTTDRWTLGGTTLPSIATTGRMTLAQGATLSATSTAVTQPTFIFQGLNFLGLGWIAKFEAASASYGGLFYLNSHRFMGIGFAPTTLSAAYTGSSTTGPMLDAIGYEIDVDGKVYPVVYANGVRTRPSLTFGGTDFNTGNGSPVTATNPGGSRMLADGNFHTYGMVIRGDYIFWYVDGNDYPCASLTFRSASYVVPNTQQSPLRFHAINGAVSAPSGTMTMQVGSLGVVDTGSNHTQIGDCNFPWRKATVTKTGGLSTIPGPSTLPSYTAAAETSTGAFSANTRKDYLSIEHSAASTKTVRIRRITVGGYQTGAVAGFIYAKVFHGTAASSAGTVQAATKTNEASAAAEAVVKVLPTITAATLKISQPIGGLTATANIGVGPVTIYDSTSGADQEPLTLRAGVLEAFSVALFSTGTNTLLPSVTIYFTEE